ncbi:chemotaxis protein CheW [Vagococcus sp. BWB3-3]|uniref:Chemotaxis protein CheW n=1 Tax=Vagococcus allomyrinae TaxID=2794353 RepID=A0A940SSJ8_9ENTE|nr:chemotaxis protein CheW [Vagococcus allomyrinae]MBP1042027.1 chemotaxis protein CheW [Vagococcus allomyrinae]
MEKQIVFASHKQRFSLPIEKIEKIIQWEQPIPVPETAKFVLGMIQYSEQILPVIDLGWRLYDKPTIINDMAKLIVVQWQNQLIGVLVELITGIEDFDTQQFEYVDSELTIDKAYIDSFIKTNHDIIIQLEVERLFADNLMLAKISQGVELIEGAATSEEVAAE